MNAELKGIGLKVIGSDKNLSET